MSSHRIVLGITGGIAAYKAADVVRGLLREGAEVTVAMTAHAREFVSPLTFQALSGKRVITSQYDLAPQATDEAGIEHIDLAVDADLLLIAPATANFLGKMAGGIADDFLSTFYLAVTCPVLVAPAMNTRMWKHPVVAENLARLEQRGVLVIPPEEGALASRREGSGVGRLADPEQIVARAMQVCRPGERDRPGTAPLSGRHVLVTAGPTRERIDAVRFLSNPSTGRMGFALAEAARDAGARVTLVTGPTHLADPLRVTTVRVDAAEEMRNAVMEVAGRSGERPDIVVMSAAVSDFRPSSSATGKIKKGEASRTVELVPNPDIAAELGRDKGEMFLVGFAAETDDVIDNARRKLVDKGLDLIVANRVGIEGSGFASDSNEVVVLDRSDHELHWPRMSKRQISERLMELIAEKSS